MKFGILKTGGKQYIVNSGSIIKVEKIIGEHKIGDKLTFDSVLATFEGETVNLGKPTTGTKIVAEVVSMAKHPKVIVLRYMPKSRWAKKNGHRQPYFEVKILSI